MMLFQQLKQNSMDYDTWFDYLRLLESEGDIDMIRETYEKAIAQIPPIQVCLIFKQINKKEMHSSLNTLKNKIKKERNFLKIFFFFYFSFFFNIDYFHTKIQNNNDN